MSTLLKKVYSECFDPQDVVVFDGISQTYKAIKVPCGKCYHCMITKVNEWVTRMQIQSMYNKYKYFVTLTYDSANYGTKLFEQTYPVVHSINKEKKSQPAPLTLCKKHLQDYFKRLRKNTNVKFQYFACGEYGDTYSRPHYHYLLWSNDPISREQMQHAWSINGQLIGHIDYVDLDVDAIDPEHTYKYVCKYLQKREFDFEKLKTKKYHYANFIKNFRGFPQDIQTWRDYQKNFSPFFLCSKRPAIGFEYFERNKTRFQKGNFELFQLPSDCIFPTYFYRKTRESLCPYKTISLSNWKPNSCSTIPQVVTMLGELQTCIEFNSDFMQGQPLAEYIPVRRFESVYTEEDKSNRFSDGKTLRDDVIVFHSTLSSREIRLPRKYFSFYDCKNKFHYSLSSDWMYNVTNGKGDLIYRLSIEDVVKEVQHSYETLLYMFLQKQHDLSEIRRRDKIVKIVQEFGSYEKYDDQRKKCISNLLNNIKDKQRKYKLTKIVF